MTPHPRALALQYAELGYPVFPVKAHGKAPATPQGFKDATTDPHLIRELFRSGHNIGTPGTERVLIIDFDVSDDHRIALSVRRAETRSLLARLEAEHPELAGAPRHGTPSGGFHSFLQLPEGARRLVTGAWPRGATHTHGELRGMNRAYVVLPPSRTPAGDYVTLTPLVPVESLPVASHELLEYLSPAPRPKRRRRSTGGARNTAPGTGGREYALEVLRWRADRLAHMQPNSGRNNELRDAAYHCAGYISDGHLTRSEIERTLMRAANDSGLIRDDGEERTLGTLTRAMAAGETAPLDAPAPARAGRIITEQTEGSRP